MKFSSIVSIFVLASSSLAVPLNHLESRSPKGVSFVSNELYRLECVFGEQAVSRVVSALDIDVDSLSVTTVKRIAATLDMESLKSQFGEQAVYDAIVLLNLDESTVTEQQIRSISKTLQENSSSAVITDSLPSEANVAVSTGDAAAVSTGDAATVSTGDAVTVSTGDAVTVSTGDAVTVSTGDAVTVSTGDATTVSSGDAATVAAGDSASRGVLGGEVAAAAAATASAVRVGSASGMTALLVDVGNPADQAMIQDTVNMLESAGWSITIRSTPAGVNAFDMLVMPGTNSYYATYWSMVSNQKQQVVNFVRNGGAYLGICQGSYLAGQNYFGFLDSQPLPKVGKEYAQIENIIFNGTPRKIYVEDSPEYVAEGSVIATYSDGTPHAMVTSFGSGSVGVIAGHPEANIYWTSMTEDSLAQDIGQYVASALI